MFSNISSFIYISTNFWFQTHHNNVQTVYKIYTRWRWNNYRTNTKRRKKNILWCCHSWVLSRATLLYFRCERNSEIGTRRKKNKTKQQHHKLSFGDIVLRKEPHRNSIEKSNEKIRKTYTWCCFCHGLRTCDKWLNSSFYPE